MAEITARNPVLVLIWSFGLFLFMHLGQYVGALLAVRRSGQTFDAIMSGKYEDHDTLLMKGIGTVVAGIPLIWIAVALLWRRPAAWMQLPFQGLALVAGLGMGILVPVLIAGMLRILGYAAIQPSQSILAWSKKIPWLSGIALLAVFTGVAEEIVFRAMAAREIAWVMGWPLAVLIAGTYFGVVHLIGQLKTLTLTKALAVLVSSILVSFLLIAMYVRSGSIWMPIGFHAAWNFSLVGILGLPMNGNVSEVSVFQTTFSGPAWLTGGTMGMEASGAALLAYVIVGLLFVLF
ncbi:CPBP family intramembrane metalloprotease [Candidatus Bipolaricaulota bacterium]|nr:CPBP family intramembrane metalloprotease [Candidatus Bipolaricaulota bacterium]